jgi:hypothetical protein
MVKFLQFGGLLKKNLGKNALAYLDSSSLAKKKRFVILTQGVNFTKLFSSSQTPWQNKLQCFFLASFYV